MHRRDHLYSSRTHCRRRTKRLALHALGVVMVVTILQSFGMGLWSSRHLQAQQAAQDTIIATTLFETRFDSPPQGSATLSAATIALAPGQASLPVQGSGTLLILVESGSITLLIDHSIDGLPPVEENDNAGESEITYHLRTGQRVTIPYVGTVQFWNEGDEISSLLLLSLVSKGGPSLPVMVANS